MSGDEAIRTSDKDELMGPSHAVVLEAICCERISGINVSFSVEK